MLTLKGRMDSRLCGNEGLARGGLGPSGHTPERPVALGQWLAYWVA